MQGGNIAFQDNNRVARITVRGSTFRNFANQVLLMGSPYLKIDGNAFINNGDQNLPGVGTSPAHHIYVACGSPDGSVVCPGVEPVTRAPGGPLVGSANQTSLSPVAVGTVTWDANDPGLTRIAPIDVGAYQH